MSSTIVFFIFVPFLVLVLLSINLIFAPRNPYQEKKSVFECGFHSFLGQNRTQFTISFFIFALLFLLFDLEILLVYPYIVSAYTNSVYGLFIMLMFFIALTIGLGFELGKKALNIDSKQVSSLNFSSIWTKAKIGYLLSTSPLKSNILSTVFTFIKNKKESFVLSFLFLILFKATFIIDFSIFGLRYTPYYYIFCSVSSVIFYIFMCNRYSRGHIYCVPRLRGILLAAITGFFTPIVITWLCLRFGISYGNSVFLGLLFVSQCFELVLQGFELELTLATLNPDGTVDPKDTMMPDYVEPSRGGSTRPVTPPPVEDSTMPAPPKPELNRWWGQGMEKEGRNTSAKGSLIAGLEAGPVVAHDPRGIYEFVPGRKDNAAWLHNFRRALARQMEMGNYQLWTICSAQQQASIRAVAMDNPRWPESRQIFNGVGTNTAGVDSLLHKAVEKELGRRPSTEQLTKEWK